MTFSFLKNDIIIMIEKYFSQKTKQINHSLENLLRQLKRSKYDENEELGNIIVTMGNRIRVNKVTKKDQIWLLIFKSLILIHKFVAYGTTGKIFQQFLVELQQSIQELCNMTASKLQALSKRLKSKTKSKKLLQQYQRLKIQKQIIQQKLLKPYFYYVSKRCFKLQKGIHTRQKIYYLINLLNSACCCNKTIYLFARYKFENFSVVQDFNYVLAEDVRGLYRYLKEILVANEDLVNRGFDQQQISDKQYNQQQILQIWQIADILRSLHEQLFHIFYNKYYFRNVNRLVPRWIDLDQYEQKGRNIRNSIKKQEKIKKQTQQISRIQSSVYEQTCQNKQEFTLEQTFYSSANGVESESQSSSYKNQRKQCKKTNINISIQLLKDMQKFVEESFCQVD